MPIIAVRGLLWGLLVRVRSVLGAGVSCCAASGWTPGMSWTGRWVVGVPGCGGSTLGAIGQRAASWVRPFASCGALMWTLLLLLGGDAA